MLEGKLLPHPPTVLSEVIAVAFIGREEVPAYWLRKTFGVRRKFVFRALQFLTQHNPLYSDVTLDEERLAELPDDDIPDEILAGVHQETREGFARKERAGYYDVEGEDEEPERASPDDGERSYLTPLEWVQDGGDQGVAHGTGGDPDVVLLRNLGCAEVDLSSLSPQQLMMYALSNVGNKTGESGYAVRHGGPPVHDLAPRQNDGTPSSEGRQAVRLFETAFPVLFPYGVGGIEADRDIKVSFQSHIQWCLQYFDRRFRTHHSFPFVMFGILRKRQALSSAWVQMRRSDFESVSRKFNTLTLKDFQMAAKEEDESSKPSDSRIALLRKHAFATGGRVQGSDASRAGYRSEIWGTVSYLGPPSLWITINPCDIHDPVAQVFTGSEIDMDQFCQTAGPSKEERSGRIARDPYAASKFFHFLVQTLLETIFAIRVKGSRVESRMGVFGKVAGYYGLVEAQGRGTLHLHMMLWLENAPTPDELKELLQTEEFQSRMVAYIKCNMHTHLEGLANEEEVKEIPKQSEIAYSRPPNPDSLNYEAQRNAMVKAVVRSCQIHWCSRDSCLKSDSKGGYKCKRRAPWPLVKEDFIKSDGSWGSRRTFGYLNGYNPDLAVMLRANHDAKILTNGEDTKNITWYCTCYATKKQAKSYNMSAILANKLAYHMEDNKYQENVQERGRQLLFRVVHILNQGAEFSGPQVISYLMGWGDKINSHRYVQVYWCSLMAELLRAYPGLANANRKRKRNAKASAETQDSDGKNDKRAIAEDRTEAEAELLTITADKQGRMSYRSQYTDYRFRGDQLSEYSFLEMMVDTYEESIKQSAKDAEPDDSSTKLRGIRSKYQICHPRHQISQRVVRAEGHNTLPSFAGAYFPRGDDPDCRELYCASMLALLKPWRSLADLKKADESWGEAHAAFLQTCSPRKRQVMSNIQLYYQCQLSAEKHSNATDEEELDEGNDRHRQKRQRMSEEDEESGDAGTGEGGVLTEEFVLITEEDWREAMSKPGSAERELQHGQHASAIAVAAGIFGGASPKAAAENRQLAGSIRSGTTASIEDLATWKAVMKKQVDDKGERKRLDGLAAGDRRDRRRRKNGKGKGKGTVPEGDVVRLEDMWKQNEKTLFEMVEKGEELTPATVDELKADQRRAYDIIDWHIRATRAEDSEDPPQLLMQLQGEGGTGKSKVIQTITELFAARGMRHQLGKAAYTGIAATVIGGETLHSFAMLSLGNREPSAQTLKELAEKLSPVAYLIIDETSMVSRPFLAKLSRVIQRAKAAEEKDDTRSFGGMNVILAGDFHQFPPVASKPNAPLYWPNREGDAEDDIIGRQIYEEFTTVVILKEQMRVKDQVWTSFLIRLRHGACGPADVAMLRGLIIGQPNSPKTDFKEDPWMDAVLVTPRHAVCHEWNECSITRHHVVTGSTIFNSYAEDTVSGRSLTLAERWRLVNDRGSRGRKEKRGQLPDLTRVAVGMKVMVTVNVETDLDIANGSRGVITGLVLDEADKDYDRNAEEVNLTRPPLYILVKLQQTSTIKLPGLEENEIPIAPMCKNYMGLVGGHCKSIKRRQLPLTAAYSFTDYRSQGQTIPYIIVDIATPPSKGITAFNVYVALSRSSGRETIRLLRDFDPQLLMQHPSEFLRSEDKRLEDLNEKTKRIWESRIKSLYVRT